MNEVRNRNFYCPRHGVCGFMGDRSANKSPPFAMSPFTEKFLFSLPLFLIDKKNGRKFSCWNYEKSPLLWKLFSIHFFVGEGNENEHTPRWRSRLTKLKIPRQFRTHLSHDFSLFLTHAISIHEMRANLREKLISNQSLIAQIRL